MLNSQFYKLYDILYMNKYGRHMYSKTIILYDNYMKFVINKGITT